MTSVEQHCRNMLEIALADRLVDWTDEYEDPDPQARSAGELCRIANYLQRLLVQEVNR